MNGTIKSRKEVNRLFENGSKKSTSSVLVIFSDTEMQRDQHGRAAFIAGKRLGDAPDRNHAKRMMREAARHADLIIPGMDLIFVARPGIKEKSLASLVREFEYLKRKILNNRNDLNCIDSCQYKDSTQKAMKESAEKV